MKKPELHDDEKALLASTAGVAAFRVLLPLLREVALYIAGHSSKLPAVDVVLPQLHSVASLERAHHRAMGRPE